MTAEVALIALALNSLVGAFMFARWLARGSAAALPPLVYFHLATALLSLGGWIAYLATARPAFVAWAVFHRFCDRVSEDTGASGALRSRGFRWRRPRRPTRNAVTWKEYHYSCGGRRGIIVRSMDEYGLRQYVRVTIGRPAENRAFLRALDQLLEGKKS